MNCQKCGKALPDDSLFCDKCGAKIERTITCPKCGEEMQEDSLFCAKCGSKIKENESPTSSTNEKNEVKSKKRKPLYIIGAILLVIVLICVSLALLCRQYTTRYYSSYNELTTTTGANTNALEVLDYGFSYIDDDPEYAYVAYGFEYKNNDSILAAGVMDIKVTSKDESGKVIDVYDDSKMIYVPPGETAESAGRTFDLAKKPSDISIEISYDPNVAYYNDWSLIKASNLRVEKEDDEYHLFGEVENTSGRNMNIALVEVIFKDNNGKIVSGDSIYVDPFSGDKSAFEQDLWAKEDAITNNIVCTAYGYLR